MGMVMKPVTGCMESCGLFLVMGDEVSRLGEVKDKPNFIFDQREKPNPLFYGKNVGGIWFILFIKKKNLVDIFFEVAFFCW